jgi:branched-chain amino acid transport system permease protein
LYQQAIVTGVTLGVAYAIMGLGFTLIYRSTRVLNLAHGAVVALVGLAVARLDIDAVVPRVVVSVLIGMVLMAVVHLVFVVPFRRSTPVARLIALLGAAFIGGSVAQIEYGTNTYTVARLAEGNFDMPIIGGRGSWHMVVSVLLVLATVVLLKLTFTYSIVGKSWRAIADDVVGARLVGIRTNRLLLEASIVAGGLAGLAAIIVVPRVGVSFSSGFDWTLIAVTTAMVGGLTSEWGAVVGGLIVGVAQGFMLVTTPEYYTTITFVLLIGTLAVRPTGLFGYDPALKAR